MPKSPGQFGDFLPNSAANTLGQQVPYGQGFYKFWQNSVAHMDIGTVVAVKFLGQTIRDSSLKQRLENETQLSAEEIPTYAVDVVGSMGTRYNDCQVMFPYVHSEPGQNGAGIYHVPEEGSQVVILASVTGQPVVMGFLNAVDRDEAGYRNQKEPLTPGSYCLKTPFGNKIIVRRGGIILVQSTPACLRRYIPTRDQIRDVCQNYFMTAEGGGIEWVKDPQTGVYTNWRHIWFDHPKTLEDLIPSAVILDVGQDKDPDKQGRSIYNLAVQDGLEAEQFRFLVRPNGYVMLRTKDNLAADDPNRGMDPSVTGGIGTTGETGTIDIDADHDIDITPCDNLRLGSTPSPMHPRDYPAQSRPDPTADFDGNPQKTTDYIHLTCEVDEYDNIGQDKIKTVGRDYKYDVGENVQRVIGDKNDALVGGSSVISVSSFFYQLGNVIHLNPSAQLTSGSITAGVNSSGAVVFSGDPGATLFTDDMNVYSVGYLENHAFSAGEIASGVPFPVSVPGGESFTVGASGLDEVGLVFQQFSSAMSFPLTRGVEYTETDNGSIMLDPTAVATLIGGPLASGDNLDFSMADGLIFSDVAANPDDRPIPLPGDGAIPAVTGSAGQYNQPSTPDSNTAIRNAPTFRVEAKGPGNDLSTFGDPGGRTIITKTPVDV